MRSPSGGPSDDLHAENKMIYAYAFLFGCLAAAVLWPSEDRLQRRFKGIKGKENRILDWQSEVNRILESRRVVNEAVYDWERDEGRKRNGIADE